MPLPILIQNTTFHRIGQVGILKGGQTAICYLEASWSLACPLFFLNLPFDTFS